MPRPLPPREDPAERELATGGDLGGEVIWGLAFDGGGGTGGRGSPPESKFPPGEDEWGRRMANFGIWDSVSPGLSSVGPRTPVPSTSSPRPTSPGPRPPPAWDLELSNPA